MKLDGIKAAMSSMVLLDAENTSAGIGVCNAVVLSVCMAGSQDLDKGMASLPPICKHVVQDMCNLSATCLVGSSCESRPRHLVDHVER